MSGPPEGTDTSGVGTDRVELLRRGYAALSRMDLEAWIADLDPDVEVYELPQIPDTDVYRGHDGVRKWFENTSTLVQSWGWTPEEILNEAGDALVVRSRVKLLGSQSSVPIEQPLFHVFRFRGAKVASIQGFLDSASAFEAAGLES